MYPEVRAALTQRTALKTIGGFDISSIWDTYLFTTPIKRHLKLTMLHTSYGRPTHVR